MPVTSTGLTEPKVFVFTDVVGSTRLWAADPEATARSFEIHDAIVRATLSDSDGVVFGWAGDSFRAVFDDRAAAVRACAAVHSRLLLADWGADPMLRVRIGVTWGQALHREGDYFGPVLNTAARLEEIANPGQTVLTAQAVVGLEGVSIAALGRHQVRDVAEPIELFQLGEFDFAPLRSIDRTLSSIPPSTGSLVGRASAVSTVRQGLDQRAPVTVVGTGGAGKTRLAIEVAHLEMRNYPDGCYFVDLAPVVDTADVGPAIARASHIPLSSGDPLGEIVAHFAGRRALLILDNCEHLVSVAQQFVRDLGRGAAGLRLLATSREALGVAGEQVVRLGPLETIEHGGPAVELFVQRIRDQSPEFEPTAGELGQIAQICEHLDGIPLALELAAARAGVLGLAHLLEGMHDRFRLFSSTHGDGTRTLREAIDWSYGLLDFGEQEFFCRCGVFSGSFDLRAAAAVMPELDPLDIADLLQSLTRKSLIAIEGALGGRFRMLETIRAYALLQLGERGDVDRIQRLHFDHYVATFEVEGLAQVNDLDRAVRLTPEWSNAAAALEWGCDQEQWEDAARIAAGCLSLWEGNVPVIEGAKWVERIVAHLHPETYLSNLLRHGSASHHAQFDDFVAVKDLMDDLVLSPDAEIRCTALALTGYMLARVTPQQSVAMFERADSVANEHALGHESRIGAWWSRGSHALYAPDLDEAFRCFRSGFDVSLAAPTRTNNAVYAGLSLAVTQLLLGRASDALATLDSYNWGDTRWDSSHIIRGVALIDLNRATEAADLILGYAYESLRGRLRRMSNDAMVGLAALALHRGERDHAWRLMQQAITPRTPFTIGLVEGLAGRIGCGDELRAAHRTRQAPLAELDAMNEVRAELDRLNDEMAERT